MKTNRDNLDLEQLLTTLEHAGRDERRQQELGDMIDRMAATESSGHGFWWWGARVAAAACILFFISTAVRIWFIPTESGNTLVAEADIPAAIGQAAADSTILLRDDDLQHSSPQRLTNALPTPYQRLTNSYHGSKRLVDEVPQQESVSEVEETAIPEEVYFAEAEGVVDIPENADTLLLVEADVEAEFEPVEQAEPEPVQPEHPVAPASKPRERKRGLLSSLIRPAEPSLMEGTTLALLEF